jgi:predicted HTH transcriptional regulator
MEQHELINLIANGETSRVQFKRDINNVTSEEKLLTYSNLSDVNWYKFKSFYEEQYKETCEKERLPLYLENLRLGENSKLNIAGALLFGQN